MRITIACVVFALLTACATGPAGKEAASNPSAAPAAGVVATAAAKPVVEPVGSAEPVAYADKPAVAKAKPGYSLSKRNGETVYCRREVPTGSRRPVENCYTLEQLEAIEAATKETQNALERQRNSSGCGKFCSAGG
jgi:hypothetical protein